LKTVTELQLLKLVNWKLNRTSLYMSCCPSPFIHPFTGWPLSRSHCEILWHFSDIHNTQCMV